MSVCGPKHVPTWVLRQTGVGPPVPLAGAGGVHLFPESHVRGLRVTAGGEHSLKVLRVGVSVHRPCVVAQTVETPVVCVCSAERAGSRQGLRVGLSQLVSSHGDHGLHGLVLRRLIGAGAGDFKLLQRKPKLLTAGSSAYMSC